MAYFHCQYPIQIFKNPKLLIRGKQTFFSILNCTFPPRTVTVIISCTLLLAGQDRNRASRNTIHDHAMPSSSEELGQRWREMWLTLWVHLRTRSGVLQPACIDSQKPVVPMSSQFHAQWCHGGSRPEIGRGDRSYTAETDERYKTETFCSWESRLLKLSQHIYGLKVAFRQT